MLRRLKWSLPVAIAVLAPILIGIWTLTAVSAAGKKVTYTGDPTQGQTLFTSGTCASCHGANLEGGVGPALNPIEHLGNTKNPLDEQYITQTITNGLHGYGGFTAVMPPKGGNDSLTSSQIQDLAAYIIQQNTVPPTLSADDLARSDVFWITVGIAMLVLLTYLLSRYNMRWIARRAAAARDERSGQP
jgi:mono/diheme cytochrome c family protein